MRFRDKPTSEQLILSVAFTVCTYVLITEAILLALAFFTDRDLSTVGSHIGDIINTLIGLLAGYLAGRTQMNGKDHNPPAGPEMFPEDDHT